MKREEQAKKDNPIPVSGTLFASGYDKGIEVGVKWADSHPNWHKYPSSKPDKEGEYFVACKDGECTLDKYIIEKDSDGKFWRMQNLCRCDDDNVEFWLEKPQPPNFD